MMVWVPDVPGGLVHTLEFFIPGTPRPWKHGQPAVAGKSKQGRMVATIIDDPKNIEHKPIIHHHFMRGVIRDGIAEMLREPWQGPVVVHTFSCFRKPKNWFPGMVPTYRNDLTNLKKMIEDALSAPHPAKVRALREKHRKAKGFVPPVEDKIYAWKDDEQIIAGIDAKLYHDREGVIVRIDYYRKAEKPKSTGYNGRALRAPRPAKRKK